MPNETKPEEPKRTDEWYVDAANPHRVFEIVGVADGWGPGVHKTCPAGVLGERWIADGHYLRIPPKPDVPEGKVVRQAREPKEGEEFIQYDGGSTVTFSGSYPAGAYDHPLFGTRRWIVEDAEPEKEEPVTLAELATRVAKLELHHAFVSVSSPYPHTNLDLMPPMGGPNNPEGA